MKILKVIHGYPPQYNAGSENYSQILCSGLSARGHEVQHAQGERLRRTRPGTIGERHNAEPRARQHEHRRSRTQGEGSRVAPLDRAVVGEADVEPQPVEASAITRRIALKGSTTWPR